MNRALASMAAAAMVITTLVFGAPGAAAQSSLPVEVQVDLLVAKLKRNMADGSHRAQAEALEAIDKIRSLIAKPPTSLSFFEAQAAFKTGDVLRAHKAATDYLTRAGRKGKYYAQTLELMLELEPQVAAARQAEEARLRREAEEQERRMLAEIKRKREEAARQRAEREEQQRRKAYTDLLEGTVYRYVGGTAVEVRVLTATSDGSLIVAGTEKDSTGGYGFHPFVARVGGDGALRWENAFAPNPSFSGSRTGYAVSAAAEMDDGGVALALEGPGFRVARLDASGGIDWVRDFRKGENAVNSKALGVAVMPGGDLLVVGARQSRGTPLSIEVHWKRLSPGGDEITSGTLGRDSEGFQSGATHALVDGTTTVYVAGVHDSRRPEAGKSEEQLVKLRTPSLFVVDLASRRNSLETLWPRVSGRPRDYCCSGEPRILFQASDGCLAVAGSMTEEGRSGGIGPRAFIAKFSKKTQVLTRAGDGAARSFLGAAAAPKGAIVALREVGDDDEPALVLFDGDLNPLWRGHAADGFPDGTRFRPMALARLGDDHYAVAGAISRAPEPETVVVLRTAVPADTIAKASPHESRCRSETWDAFADGSLDLPGIFGNALRSLTGGNVSRGFESGPGSVDESDEQTWGDR